MYFPLLFQRTVTGGGALLPATSAPTGAPSTTADDQNAYSAREVNGWPVHRIAVAYSGPVDITADLYIYEAHSKAWYKTVASATTLKAGCITYFDVPTTFSVPPTLANLQGVASNGANIALVPIDPGGLTNGTYIFAAAPDLTTFG